MHARGMRRTLLIGLLCAASAAWADDDHDAVLSAIAADAGADVPPPPPSPLHSRPLEQVREAQAVAVVPRGTCNLKVGETWQSQPELSFEECAAALDSGQASYDASGLRHAYWQGVFLSASSKAIYESRNGRDWTKLRDLGAR